MTSRGISGASFPKVHIGTLANLGRDTEITVGQLRNTTFGTCGCYDLANSASTKDCVGIQVLACRTEARWTHLITGVTLKWNSHGRNTGKLIDGLRS